MYLSKIVFGDCDNGRVDISRYDIAEDYLAKLFRNGQTCGEYLIAPSNGKLVAYVRIARPGAFAKQHHSQWGLASLQAVIEAFGQAPQCDIIQDDVPKRLVSWKKSSSLYLFTHAFDDASPVCCGDSGLPIPMYLLPISDQTREDLSSWKSHYKEYDNVWFSSGALEIPAYRQMADPTSELSAVGRELCKEIEAATGKKTFYYLQRYWGRKLGEQNRACPMCRRPWHTSEGKSENSPFWNFSFRCIRCRLVSHSAVAYDDERHAVIGEHPKRKNAKGKTLKSHNKKRFNK
jgi:predicted  nucleic acid-binding Zn ribbon protein